MLDGALGRRLARRGRLDVMHFTGNTGWGRPCSVPFVLTIHDVLFMDAGVRNRSLRQIVGHGYASANVRRAVEHAAVVTTVSAASAAAIKSRLALTRSPTVIPHGVHLAAPSETGGRPSESYVLAFSGRDERKGIDAVVDAWQRLGDSRPKLFVMAGAGMPPGLEERTSEDRDSGNLRLFPYLPKGELTTLLENALALVYPSRGEGFGFPVLEAMAAGTPVITGLSPATREVAGDAALAIDEADPVSSIAAGLEDLIRDPTRREELQALGRARAADYEWAAVGRRYAELYGQVAHGETAGEGFPSDC